MDLPIDARRAPFKPKYIDEETPMFARWFIFGRDVKDGTIHLCDGQDDIMIGLTQTQAIQIKLAREKFVDAVMTVLNGDVI